MRIPKKTKLNNLGMTLVEVVMAIAIVGLVAVPLMNLFFSGTKVNKQAREVEAAQMVAQNVSEAIEAEDFNVLLEQMNNGSVNIGEYTGLSVMKSGSEDVDGNCPKYTLSIPSSQIEGNTTEKYNVDIVLETKESEKSTLPEVVDIGSGNANVMRICKEYFKYDTVYASTGCKKVTTFNIKCTHIEDNKYRYDIDMDILYGTTLKENVYRASNTILYDGNNGISLFLLCNYFDVATAYSSDKVIINYDYDGTEAEIPCEVYLVGQSIEAGGHGVEFLPDNITINKNGHTGMKVFSNVSGVVGIESKPVRTRDIYSVYQLTITATGEKDGRVGMVNTTVTR